MNTRFFIKSAAVVAALYLLPVSSAFAQTEIPVAAPSICPACPDCPCAEPEVKDGWDLSAALGFNLTDGNSNTLLLNGLAVAYREIGNNIYRFEITGAEGTNDDQDDEVNGTTTQRYVRGDADYKRLLSDRLYAGANLSFNHDSIADVDYRYIPSVTLGYFFIKEEDLRFNAEVGPSYVFEKVGGDKRDYFAPRIAERLEWDISETAKVFEAVELLFSVDDGDDTLVTAEVGIEAAISTQFSLVLSVKDIYDNLPAAGRDRNDVVVVSACLLYTSPSPRDS